jgi:hypothetical protein
MESIMLRIIFETVFYYTFIQVLLRLVFGNGDAT